MNQGHRETKLRSEGKCEAMLMLPRRQVWTRCWQSPTEVHHLLTRARGGTILDQVGESYHLIDLCPDCHRRADGGDAYMGGLLIDGYVTTDNGHVVYNGSDEYLSKKYPRRNK